MQRVIEITSAKPAKEVKPQAQTDFSRLLTGFLLLSFSNKS